MEPVDFEQMSADQHLELAHNYEEAEQFERALLECDAAIQAARLFLSGAYNLRGIILEGLGQDQEAMQAYNAALAIEPSFREAADNLLELESELGIGHELVTIAACSYPEEAHVLRAKLESEGVWSFVADEYTITANWLYSRAVGGVKLKVREVDVERAREILGLDQGDEDEEEISEIRCPNCNSDDVRYERWSSRGVFGSWLLLSFPLPVLKGTWHCRKCGHEWKSDEEANVEHLCRLADTHADESNWDDAIRLYRVAIELDPSNSDLHNSLGVAYDESGQAEEAEQAYRQAIAFDSENSIAYYNLGALYEEQRRVPEAIDAFKECLRCSSDPDERTDVTQKLKGLETRTARD